MNPSTTTAILRSRGPSPVPSSSQEAVSTSVIFEPVEDNNRTRTQSGSMNLSGVANNECEDDVSTLSTYPPIGDFNDRIVGNDNRHARDCVEVERDKLRLRLALHFMNPIDKFIARRQVPWKLLLQFLKVILVTRQLLVFGQYRFAQTNYYEDTKTTFQHLFLSNWDTAREVNSYPPPTGKFAIYRKSEFYDMFNFSVKTFAVVETVSAVPFYRNSSFWFCVEFLDGGIWTESDSPFTLSLLSWPTKTITNCTTVPNQELNDLFNSEAYLKKIGMDVPWGTMQRMYFNFSLNSLTYRRLGTFVGPECFNMRVHIEFNNVDHDGQILVYLTSNPVRISCDNAQFTTDIDSVMTRILNYVVIVSCILSLLLCTRALLRAQRLSIETSRFFSLHCRTHLTLGERFQFLNLWYVTICVNDVLLITGSIITELIETRKTSGVDLWDFCSIFLGTGNLLVWIGMLRYLGFFKVFNSLILTIKWSLPNVLRFALCAGIVYFGYMFCGWIVFAPFHLKFRTLSSTSECLFSLINGDDMFATFSMMPEKQGIIRGFSRIYLYTFVMLFIYVILSLFIAIIMDTYENIKQFYEEGFPKSRIDEFYHAIACDPYTVIVDSQPSFLYIIWSRAMINIYGRSWKGYAREARQQCSESDVPSSESVATMETSARLVVT